MTDVTQKALKKKPSRRFDSKDPVINDIYQQVMEKMFQEKTILKPFEYDFDEATGTHTLTYENFLRFVRQEKSRRIDVYVKNITDQWVEAVPSSDLQEAYISKNSSKGSDRVVSPVMWPVLATNQSLTGDIHSPVSEHMNSFFRPKEPQDITLNPLLQAPLPEAQSDLDEKASFNQKLHKLMFAMTLIWQGKTKKFRFANTKSGVAKWWDKFVDRDTLKMFVSVLGNSKHSHLTWVQLAFATQHPNLDQLIKKVKDMGGEKILLRSHPFDQWENLTPKELLDPTWVQVWDRVKTLPPTLQKAMANAGLPRPRFERPFMPWDKRPQEEKDAELARYAKAHQDYENMLGELKSPPAFYLFEQYQKVSEKNKWSTRELDMLFKMCHNMACQLERSTPHNPFFEEPPLSSQTKKDWDNMIAQTSWVGDFISSYRACHSDDFKKWSASNQARFVSVATNMVKDIIDPNGKTYHNKEMLAPIRAKMEEIALQRALGEKIKQKKKEEKKTVKKKKM